MSAGVQSLKLRLCRLLQEISNCTRLQRLCLSSPGLPPVHEIVMALPRSLTALSLSKVEEADIFEIFRQRGLKDLKVLLDIDDSDFSRVCLLNLQGVRIFQPVLQLWKTFGRVTQQEMGLNLRNEP